MSNNTFNLPINNELLASAQRHKAEIDAVPVNMIQYVYAEPTSVVRTVLKAEPRYMHYRPRMEKLSSELDLRQVDDCASYGRAYWYLASELSLVDDGLDIPALYAEALKKRELFQTIREGLGMADITDSKNLRAVGGSVGHEAVAGDLVKHVAFFRRKQQELAGKIPIASSDVDYAESLAVTLVVEGGGAKPALQLVAGSPQLAMYQAGTLFLRAYAEVRRGIGMIRFHEGDTDEISPPVYSGRTAPTRKQASEQQPEPAASAPTATAPAPSAAAPFAPATPANDVPVGFPGSNPFMR